MSTSNRVVVESRAGTKTKKFKNASSLIWNAKRRFK